MLEQGFIDEVAALYQRGDLTDKMPSIRAVGYRQVWSYLQGEYDVDTMTEKAIIATRQLAKRQFTWLRRENEAVNFISGQPDLLSSVLSEVLGAIEPGKIS
jgi:tRNA dimethylallyltransferase